MPVTKGGGFNITSIEPVDNRFTINNSSDRLGFVLGRTFEGLTTYASSSQTYWVLSDKSNYDNTAGWSTIYISDPGGQNLSITGTLYVSNSLILTGGADFFARTTESFGARFRGFGEKAHAYSVNEFQTSVSGVLASNFYIYGDDYGILISTSLSDKTYTFYSRKDGETLPEDDWENGIFYFYRSFPAAGLDDDNLQCCNKITQSLLYSEPSYRIVKNAVTRSSAYNASRGMGTSIQLIADWNTKPVELFVGEVTQSITQSIGTSSGASTTYYSISSSGDINAKQVISTRLIAEDAYLTASYFTYQGPTNPVNNTNFIYFKNKQSDEKLKLVFKDSSLSSARAHELITFNSRSFIDPSGSNTFTLGHNALILHSQSSQYGTLMPGPDGANVPITKSTATLWVGGNISASKFLGEISASSIAADSITASYFSASVITASIISASEGITGSLYGTSSWAVSSSYAITASHAVTSSYALTASYMLASNVDTTVPFSGTVSAGIISASGQLFAGISQGTISEADAEIAIYDTSTGNFYYTSSEWIQKIITVAGADLQETMESGSSTSLTITSSATIMLSGSGVVVAGTLSSSFLSASIVSGGEGYFESGSNIGPAEDGTYDDGLFNFTSHSKVGHAIDKINEVLTGLVPAEAPNLQYLGDDETLFISAKLGIGSTGFKYPASYNPLVSIGTLSAYEISDTLPEGDSGDGSGGDYDLGVVNSNTSPQIVTGKLNAAVPQNGGLNGTSVNYSASAFGNANEGELHAYFNKEPDGSPDVSIDLTTTNAATQSTANGITLYVTATSSGYFSTGVPFASFVNRTGSYSIATSTQDSGSNTLKIIHTSSEFERTTNYIRWVNAQNSPTASVDNNTIDLQVTGSGTKYLSGVPYYTGAYLTYSLDIYYLYYPVYSATDNNLGVTLSNFDSDLIYNKYLIQTCSVRQPGGTLLAFTSQSDVNLSATAELADSILDVADESYAFNATSSVTFLARIGSAASINQHGYITCDNTDTTYNIGVYLNSLTVLPGGRNIAFGKTGISNFTDFELVSQGWLLDNRQTTNETLYREPFVSESYRRIPGDYDSQPSVGAIGATWNSGETIEDAATNDDYTSSLLVMPRWVNNGSSGNGTSNGMLVYPSDSSTVPAGGNFDTLDNAHPSAPDYDSTAVTGDRTYYRFFQNDSGADITTFYISMSAWSSGISIIPTGSDLSTTSSAMIFEVKHPEGTGWLDLGATNAQDAGDDLTVDGASARLGGLTTVGTSYTGYNISVGNTATSNFIANGEKIVIKITTNNPFNKALKEIRISDFE